MKLEFFLHQLSYHKSVINPIKPTCSYGFQTGFLAWTGHWGTTEGLEKYDTWLPIATSVKTEKENPDNIIYCLYIYMSLYLIYINIYIYIYICSLNRFCIFLNNNYIDLVYVCLYQQESTHIILYYEVCPFINIILKKNRDSKIQTIT